MPFLIRPYAGLNRSGSKGARVKNTISAGNARAPRKYCTLSSKGARGEQGKASRRLLLRLSGIGGL